MNVVESSGIEKVLEDIKLKQAIPFPYYGTNEEKRNYYAHLLGETSQESLFDLQIVLDDALPYFKKCDLFDLRTYFEKNGIPVSRHEDLDQLAYALVERTTGSINKEVDRNDKARPIGDFVSNNVTMNEKNREERRTLRYFTALKAIGVGIILGSFFPLERIEKNVTKDELNTNQHAFVINEYQTAKCGFVLRYDEEYIFKCPILPKDGAERIRRRFEIDWPNHTAKKVYRRNFERASFLYLDEGHVYVEAKLKDLPMKPTKSYLRRIPNLRRR